MFFHHDTIYNILVLCIIQHGTRMSLLNYKFNLVKLIVSMKFTYEDQCNRTEYLKKNRGDGKSVKQEV